MFLLLGAFALQMLPINFAGLSLIVVGIGLMIVEAVSPSFGVFGLGGVVAFVLGSIMLMDTDLEAYQISLSIIAAFAVASAGVFLYALGAVYSSRHRQVTTGTESMIGAVAIAIEDFDHAGRVRAFSENWKAESDQPISKGDAVKVVDVDGLTLKVKPEQHASGEE